MAKKVGAKKKNVTKAQKLELARKHLQRALEAWNEPDWDDLSMYGFYCLEAAVEAAALHIGMKTTIMHAQKAEIAAELHEQAGLPDVSDLLVDLNSSRKAVAYGDMEAPELDAEDVTLQIEEYVDAVADLIEK